MKPMTFLLIVLVLLHVLPATVLALDASVPATAPALASAASPSVVKQPEPNAAIGYLMALGFLEPASKEVINEFAEAKTIATLEKLSPEARNYLAGKKFGVVANLLSLGAACELSRFGYEHTYRPEEPVPPFRRLRELGRIMRTYGLDLLKKGNPDRALDIFRSLFRLGGHLEVDGTLISGMIGVAIRNLALEGFEELAVHGKNEKSLTTMREFLKLQPTSVSSMNLCLEAEKRYTLTALQMIASGADKVSDEALAKDWDSIKIILPEEEQAGKTGGNGSVTAPSAFRECIANQRVLAGAVEMLCLDYNPMPATLTVDLIPEFLAKEKYLKVFPTCRDNGKYQVSKVKDGLYEWKCTVHPTPEASGESGALPVAVSKPTKEQIQKFRDFVLGADFKKMKQEIIDLFDEAKTFDPRSPDFEARTAAFQKKIESSSHQVVKNCIPNVKKAMEQQLKVDRAVEKLVSGK